MLMCESFDRAMVDSSAALALVQEFLLESMASALNYKNVIEGETTALQRIARELDTCDELFEAVFPAVRLPNYAFRYSCANMLAEEASAVCQCVIYDVLEKRNTKKWPEMEEAAQSWLQLGKTSKFAMLTSSVPAENLAACRTRIPSPDHIWVLEQWFDRLEHVNNGRLKNNQYCVGVATSLRNIKAAIPTSCEFFKPPGDDNGHHIHTDLYHATRVFEVAKSVRL